MKTIFTGILALLFISIVSFAQDTLYIYKGGKVVSMRDVTNIDSIIFYKPVSAVTDIDGNVYKTVKIGSQEWMAENLKTTKYNDGTAIPLVPDEAEWAALSTPGYCWYDNDEVTNKATYGALYNWYTVNTGKLCPKGWTVPADSEWKTLEMYLGLSQSDADATEWRGTDQGTQLKNTTGWNSGGNGTNTSGFSALPGGGRDENGTFSTVGNYGFWWSSAEYNTTNAWYRKLYPDFVDVYRNYYYKKSGLSVRCIRDSLIIITTQNTSEITTNSAKSGGNISYDGVSPVTARGVCWSTHENPTIADGLATNSNDIDSFSCSLTGLTVNTKYYVRAYATNTSGTVYGNEIMFATKGETGTVADMDGNTYSTVAIGSQTWMAENLKTTKFNDGTAIPLVKGDEAWTALSTPGYCWYNNNKAANEAAYGALYNWYTVNAGKLCPTGWHVPNDTEWTVLTDYLGGEGAAGGKLKEAGLVHWKDPNDGASNETGFTAVPGGQRYLFSYFIYAGYNSYWWSSTEHDTDIAWFRVISYNPSYVYRSYYDKHFGFSARCLQDK